MTEITNAVAAASGVFFLVVTFAILVTGLWLGRKWLNKLEDGGGSSGGQQSLDGRITSYMPQNNYGKREYRGVRKSGWYKPGHES